MIGGDFAKLRALAAKVAALPDAAKARVLTNVAAELVSLVQLGFASGTSPSGAPWAPLKHRVGQPLRKTGRLGNSFTAHVAGDKAIVGTNVAYAGYHQTGTRYAPARQMIPSGALPPAWRAAVLEAAQEALAAALGEVAA